MSKTIDIEAFIAGDIASFEALYNIYVGKIYNYINSFVSNNDLAKDITQDAFLQIWNSRTNLKTDGNIEAYIYTISRNLLFHELRRRNIFNTYAERVQEEAKEAEESHVEEDITRDMIEQQILSLLVELPETRRKIFMMRWSKGLSNKEIARELSISEKTVSTQIHRTVSFLKSKMGSLFMVMMIIKMSI